jgi:ribosomal-protein-alanine N-acetyltransferase
MDKSERSMALTGHFMHRQSFFIRSYQESDRESCEKLWAELTEHHRGLYSDPSIGGADSGIYFDRHLGKVGPGRVWLAETGGEVVGMVSLMMTDEEAEIEPIIVRKQNRGQGIGTALLQHAIQEAKEAGLHSVSIKPVARNREAIRLFRRVGFDTVGVVEFFVDLRCKKRIWKTGLKIFGISFRY